MRPRDDGAGQAAARPALPDTVSSYRAIYSYAPDAGAGSATFESGRGGRWRAALLGSVAAGALMFGYGRSARAQCVALGAVATCQGNLSAGIASGVDFPVPATTTLDVNNLSQDIAPAGAGGIFFLSAGDITINSDTGPFRIVTQGNVADGVFAFSYGGGAVTVTQTGDIATRGAYSYGIYAYSAGGPVTVTQTGDITTEGFASYGIYAVSTGGAVTVTQTGDVSTRGFAADALHARSIGAGPVTVTQTGDITTQGVLSYGIYAYTTGTAAVTVTHTGDIATAGAYADGIYVVSNGGAVTVTQTGDITVTGTGADAIDVNNAVGAGNSTVTIAAGSTITGGSGTGDGVGFQDGNLNRLINFGTIGTLGENAIEGEGTGSEIVDNFGTVTGNVDLGPGANAFNNMAGGLFNAGTTVNLGAGNLLTNAGTFAPGGVGTLQTTTLTGNLVQTGTGSLATDIRFGSLTADLTNVTGTSNLSGQVAVNIVNPGFAQPGTQQVTILSSAGGVTNAGLTVQDAAVVDYRLLFPNATDVVLGVTVDFAPAGLNRNQTALGAHVNAIQTAGGSAAFAPVAAALVSLPDLASLANAYDQLGPEAYLATEIASLFASLDFTDGLMSCRVRDGAFAIIREGQCLWARAQGRFLDRDRTRETIAFEEDVGSFSGGAQVALAPNWHAGLAIGYERSHLETATGVESDSDRLQGGASLKWNRGPLLLAGAISGGNGWYDTTRSMAFGGFFAQARSDHDVSHGTGQLRAAYLLGRNGGWYAKPMVDLNATYLDLDGFTERGAGGANLIVSGSSDWVLSVSPALEIGAEFARADGTLVRPFVRAGLTAFDDPEFRVASIFQGAPAGVQPFATRAETDDVFADVAAGIDVLSGDGTVLRVFYDGRFAEDTTIHAGGVKASLRF